MFEQLPRPDLDMKKLGDIHEMALRAAARSENPVIAELAREVRAGNVTLRDAVSGAYRDAFAEATDKLLRVTRDLSEDDLKGAEVDSLDELAERIAQWDEQADDAAAPAEQPSSPAAEKKPDDEYFGAPIMIAAAPVDPATTTGTVEQPTSAERPDDTDHSTDTAGTEGAEAARDQRSRRRSRAEEDDAYFDGGSIMTTASQPDRSAATGTPPQRARWNRRRT